jgi:hypothetical protein
VRVTLRLGFREVAGRKRVDDGTEEVVVVRERGDVEFGVDGVR